MREGKTPKQLLDSILKGDELRVSHMQKLFAKGLSLFSKAQELEIQGIRALREDNSPNRILGIAPFLLTRLFNHQLAARKLFLMGYITETASILARALETSWLIRYFDCYPNEIERWWDKKKHIRPKETREELKRALKEDKIRIGDIEKEGSLYQELCEIGHPDFYGSIWHAKVKSVSPLNITFHLGGYANPEMPESLKGAFKWLIEIQIHSLFTMAAISEEFLANNQAWWEDCSALLESLHDYCHD